MKTIYIGETYLRNYEDAKKQPQEVQRYMYYSGKIRGIFHIEESLEKDGKIYYSKYDLKVRFGSALFAQKKCNSGFTIDKTTNEIKVWFGQKIENLSSSACDVIFNYYKMDWFDKKFTFMLNKTIMRKIISGKITNTKDVIRQWLRLNSQLRNLNLSIDAIYNCAQFGGDVYHRLLNCMYIKNPNMFFDSGFKMNMVFEDTLNQAKILNRKINLKWSDKRLDEIHKEWTREIMEMELNYIDEVQYYSEEQIKTFPSIPGLTLIPTKQELFKEGTRQNHCVYTNYEYLVSDNRYFVLNFTNHSDSTIGIQKNNNGKWYIQQMYGRYNSKPDERDKESIEIWLNTEESQKWFNDISKSNSRIKEPELDNLYEFV
jgi:hypothetical protein